MDKLKGFNLWATEVDWFIGRNEADVMKFIADHLDYGEDVDAMIIDHAPEKVDRVDLIKLKFFVDPDNSTETITFEERMLEVIANKKDDTPEFFATTEF